MEFQNSDFEADRVRQYESIRVALANIYIKDTTLFGPPSAISSPLFEVSDDCLEEETKRQKQKLLKQRQEEQNQIKKGYQRVQEKLKEIKQNFSTAVTTGRRSGSGKIVLQFYDELVQIWDGSPSTQPLSCGTSTQQINVLASASIVPGDDESNEDSDDDLSNSVNHTLPSEINEVEVNSTQPKVTSQKRKPENIIPKLIDNKRKHMERQLSAAKRDELLLKESKEDLQFKKDMVEAIRESNRTFENSMQNMSFSIAQVGQSLTQSMEIMARAFMQQNSPNNMPYAHHYSLTTVEEITDENRVIRLVLDLKQHEWTKAETTSKNKKKTEANNTTNPVTSPNRFQALPVEEQQDDSPNEAVNSENHMTENDLDQQIIDYCKNQSTKFRNLKKNNKRRPTEAKTKTINTTTQEKAVLLIGDSMVKNIDRKKLERAARKNTVCHSYSGAKVGQMKEKIKQYWSEDCQYEEIILHVGTNNLANEQPERVAEQMEELINKVKVHTKKIAVSSVIKRYDNKVNARNISNYNNLVHELCIKHNITFIDNDFIDQP